MVKTKRILDILMFAIAVMLVVTAIFHGHMDHEVFAHIHGFGGLLFTILLGIHVKLNWKAVLLYLGIRKRRAA